MTDMSTLRNEKKMEVADELQMEFSIKEWAEALRSVILSLT